MSELCITKSPTVITYRRGLKRNRSIDRSSPPGELIREIEAAGVSQQPSERRTRRNLAQNEADLSLGTGIGFDFKPSNAAESNVAAVCSVAYADVGSICRTKSNLTEGNQTCNTSDVCESVRSNTTSRRRSARLDKGSPNCCEIVQQTTLRPAGQDVNELDSDNVKSTKEKCNSKKLSSAEHGKSNSSAVADQSKSGKGSGMQETKEVLLPIVRLDKHEEEICAPGVSFASQQESIVNNTPNEGVLNSSTNGGVNCASEAVSLKPSPDKMKTATHGRLSLKGRKGDVMAPIFKLNTSRPLNLDTKTEETPKDSRIELSETVPVAAAPALTNLGNTCFFNSIIQILYYTPSFVDCVSLLATEIAATTRDNDTLASLEGCNLPPLTGFACWKFVERLHELFQLMRKADARFSSGCADIEAISPSAILNQLEMMNSLFTGGQQQDAHEMLRCLLSYIQDSIKLLNSHRSALASARSSAVNNAVKHVKSGGDIHSTQPSVISAVARKSEHKQSVRAESKATETQVPGNVGRITSFFARADPKPKSISDVLVKTVLVSDFIENTYEGLVERKTRCLECEDVTKRSESFQDMGVVVQKSGTSKNSTKEEDDSFEEKTGNDNCWIVESLEEVERLQADNKYWCGRCEHLVEAERSVEFRSTPDILTIQLKRFSAFSSTFFGSYTKTMDCVFVPFEMQCLEKQCRECPEKTSHRYELFAILSHNGTSLSSGHYISYVRSPVNAKLIDRVLSTGDDESTDHRKCVLDADVNLGPWWYMCDDDTVTLVSQSDLQQKLTSGGASTPYLLFYRRPQTAKAER